MRTQIVTLVVADAPPWQAVKARALISTKGNIVELLIAAGFAPSTVLLAASAATGLPTAPASWLREPQVPEVAGLDPGLCRQLGAAPIASVAGKLCIGFADPEVAIAADALGLPKHTPYLALPADMARAIATLPDPDSDPATYAQNTAPAAVAPTLPPAAWEPPSESAVPTRALSAQEIRALSQQAAPVDAFDVPTELVPGLASTAASRAARADAPLPWPAPPVTASEVPTLDVPSHYESAEEVPLAHQVTAAEGIELASPSTASGLVWDPAAEAAPSSVHASPTAPTVAPPRAPVLPRLPTPLAAVPSPVAPRPASVQVASSGELADALSDAMRAIGAVPPPRVLPTRPPPVFTDTFGQPTMQNDTRQEAREYLVENPPTILQKGPQGTKIEPVRLLVLGAPTEDIRPERALERASSGRRIALPVIGVVAALVAAVVWWFVRAR